MQAYAQPLAILAGSSLPKSSVNTGGFNPPYDPALDRQPLTAFTAEQPATLSAGQFISYNADLRGLEPAGVAIRLGEQLTKTPVEHYSVLDALSLLRAFVPPDAPAHYGLMLRDSLIIDCLYIPVQHDIEHQFLFAYDGDTRELSKRLLACDATALVLATTMNEDTVSDRRSWVNSYGSTQDELSFIDVTLLDWLFLYPYENISNELLGMQAVGYNATEEGLTDDDITYRGINSPTDSGSFNPAY